MTPKERMKVAVEKPSDEVKQAGEIAQIMQEIQERMELLATAVMKLEDKIGPVLMPATDVKELPEKDVAATAVGGKLLEVATNIMQITGKLNSLQARVAL